MEKKQTAVEWYIEQHNELLKLYNNSNMTALDLALAEDKLKFRAKQMEKERMWDYIKTKYCIGDKSLEFHKLEFEQYYNETYGG